MEATNNITLLPDSQAINGVIHCSDLPKELNWPVKLRILIKNGFEIVGNVVVDPAYL